MKEWPADCQTRKRLASGVSHPVACILVVSQLPLPYTPYTPSMSPCGKVSSLRLISGCGLWVAGDEQMIFDGDKHT